jgi:hypothetical protein
MQMTKATLRKMETIMVKMEDLTPEIKESSIKHELIAIKSRMIALIRKAEAA